MVPVRDPGRGSDVNNVNTFGSLTDIGEVNIWDLTLVDSFPPPLQVDDSDIIMQAESSDGGPTWE